MHKRLLMLASLVMCFSVNAEIYKWVDENGIVHYGDKQTPQDDAVELNVQTESTGGNTIDDAGREEKRQRLLEAMEEDRLEKKEQREKDKAELERKRKRCLWLKDKLKRTQSAGGIYRLDKQGKRVFMSSEQRKKSEQKLRNKIQKACR